MTLVHRGAALAGVVALTLSGYGISAAAPATTTFPLRGTHMASMSHGIAQVTQTSMGDFKVTLTVEGLPAPATLKTTPVRHAYVGWAFAAPAQSKSTSGKPKTGGKRPQMGAMTPIRLHATTAGTYTGTGEVMMAKAPAILITAEVSGTVDKPATPLWGVLIGIPGSV